MAMLIPRHRRRLGPGSVVAALDIGTSKVCCLIAAVEPGHGHAGPAGWRLRGLGLGHQRSAGIDAGGVVDLRLAQPVVAAAVAQAERMARTRLDMVHLGIAGGRPRSLTFNGHVGLPQGIVQDAELGKLSSGARAYATRDGSALLALERIAYSLDGAPAIADPRGLSGRRLDASHHAVVADDGPVRNMILLAESCHLEVAGLVPAGLAAALAVTTEDERRHGVTCIDIGGSVTSIAAFADGHFVFNETLSVGGQHVTRDIAYTLANPVAEAERIKTLYGTVVVNSSDEHELVPYSVVGEVESGAYRTTRARLGEVVRQRTGSILTAVRGRLESSPAAAVAGRRVVVTGGAAQVLGLSEFAAEVLGRPVRIAVPPSMIGLAGSVASPAFSCLVGLAMAAVKPDLWLHEAGPGAARQGYLGRVEQWLRESF